MKKIPTRKIPTPLALLLAVLGSFTAGYTLAEQTKAPAPLPPLNATYIAFSPSGGGKEAVINLLKEARHTAYIAIYCFNHPEIAQAVIEAKERGVKVYVLACATQRRVKGEQLSILLQHGVPVRTAKGVRIMHSKFIVVDDQHVLTGSFNFTLPADERNFENIIRFTDPSAARRYKEAWTRHWETGKDLEAIAPLAQQYQAA